MSRNAAALQLELKYDEVGPRAPVRPVRHPSCAACREREASRRRPGAVRGGPYAALCFECFRREIERLRASRQAIPPGPAGQTARRSPAGRYEALAERRRHAQIAARHALEP